MKPLNVYNQVSHLSQTTAGSRYYENAALKRRGAVFQLPMDSKPELPLSPIEKYQIYKRPLRTPLSLVEESVQHSEKQTRTPLPAQQMQEAIAQYRRISSSSINLASELDKLVRGLGTGQIQELSGEYSQKVILEYKRRRDEVAKTREKELWHGFDVKHMLYIDDDRISKQIENTTAGQVMNYVI